MTFLYKSQPDAIIDVINKYYNDPLPDAAKMDLLIRMGIDVVWNSQDKDWEKTHDILKGELEAKIKTREIELNAAVAAGKELSQTKLKDLIKRLGGKAAVGLIPKDASKDDYVAAAVDVIRDASGKDFKYAADVFRREARSDRGKAGKGFGGAS